MAVSRTPSINADPDLLERVARELERIAQEIASEKRGLNTAAEETRSVWQSRHTGQFLASVEATSARAGRCAEQVATVARSLRTMAAEIRRVEREIQQLKGR